MGKFSTFAAIALLWPAAAMAGDLVPAEQAAMAKLSFMDGLWRGPASVTMPDGVHAVIQTERIGPLLDGTVKVIEGRGYRPDGSAGFNAFGIISFDPAEQKYTLRSYAEGRAGSFALTPTADGYVWEIPAGPMIIRYTCKIAHGTWHETGERVMPGKDPVPFFEMTLTRIGNTDWPAAAPVPPQ